MALNWNVKEVENHNELFHDPDEHGNRKMKWPYSHILESTMILGIRSITEKNYMQFYSRMRFLEQVHGPFRWQDDDKGCSVRVYTQEHDIKRMIGLKTNASTKTKAKFVKDIVASHERLWDAKL